MNRAYIVSAPSNSLAMLEQAVRIEGFGSVAVISGCSEARRLIKGGASPDIIIINTPLSDEFGQELAETAAEETSAGIILICSGDIADELADRLSDYGVTVLARPVSRETLSRHIRLITANRSRMSGLKKETPEIMNRIEEMRVINRAKTVLMKYLKFTEPQAHRYIEKQAMNNRQTRREVAERVIEQYEK
ncbi:MAG: ANTAR domain-containing protein [Ruminococcus sp.]|jgi:response regulator NasT|nr:ANTAR domain-containing protein [Ruminococcus sp.]